MSYQRPIVKPLGLRGVVWVWIRIQPLMIDDVGVLWGALVLSEWRDYRYSYIASDWVLKFERGFVEGDRFEADNYIVEVGKCTKR